MISHLILVLSVEWLVEEGVELEPPTTSSISTAVKPGRMAVAKVRGSARNILLGERPALNMIARASGIATR